MPRTGQGAPLYGYFQVHRNGVSQAGITPQTSGGQLCQFTTAKVDMLGWYNATTFRFQPDEAGWYWLFGQVNSACNAEKPRAFLCKNGAAEQGGDWVQQGAGTGVGESSVFGMVFLNGSTDFADLRIYTPATVTTMGGNATDSFFGGFKVDG